MIRNSTIKALCIIVFIGVSTFGSCHTLSDSRRKAFSKNDTTQNISIISTSINQDVRDKRFEMFKTESVNTKVEDCVTSNNSASGNETQNCSLAHVSTGTTETLVNMTGDSPKWLMNIKSGALERTGFVALGIMSILVFFFVIRAIRVRQKKSKSRKYGIIASTVSDVEMEPLERGSIEDEEEETTLFDAQQKFRIK